MNWKTRITEMDYDNKFIILNIIILTPIVVISTIIQHLFPQIFQVPNVRGPYWYPYWIDLILIDVIVSVMTLLVIYHGFKTQGKFKTTCFLFGSIIFAGLEECIWILGGRFNIIPFKTYFFTRGGLWFIQIPLSTCLAWFIIVYCCLYMAEIIFPNRRDVFQALIAGILATSLDLFMDPVMVNLGSTSRYSDSMGMWVWLTTPSETFSIFSIPFFNFLGWFFIIVLISMYYKFILDEENIQKWGKNKSSIIFYGLIPLLLIFCLGLIFLVHIIFGQFLVGVDLIPIGSV